MLVYSASCLFTQYADSKCACLFALIVVQINGATVITTLTISVVWIVYSMIPPYLLIHYTWIGRGTTLQFMCRVAFVLSFATSICAMLLLWAVYPKDYDFGSATKVGFSPSCVCNPCAATVLLQFVFLRFTRKTGLRLLPVSCKRLCVL